LKLSHKEGYKNHLNEKLILEVIDLLIQIFLELQMQYHLQVYLHDYQKKKKIDEFKKKEEN